MASLSKAPRKLASFSRCSIQYRASTRGLRTSSRLPAAQNFTMPAMSPTMTEGNIANWKVGEGDSFLTGDVLLEIETDKAQMDVEAQDDGKMAKITQQAGAKGIKVGSRIAILAETDDDLSTLSLPAEDPPAKTESPKETPQPSTSTPSSSSPPPTPPKKPSGPSSSSKPHKQNYPLYPSVSALLHQHNLPPSTADTIPASGPKGRLLKGDVLAHLGQISQSYPSEQSARITKLSHLDLSTAKPVPPPAAKPSTPSTPAPPVKEEQEEPSPTEIAVPISLTSVLAVQKRAQEALGVTLPLSTFLARATELANEDLPRGAATALTADELFNDVLGLTNVNRKVSRGDFIPQITALPAQPISGRRSAPQRRKEGENVYDMLTGKPKLPSVKVSVVPPPPGLTGGGKAGDSTNVFSVTAAKGEEKRARVFLERVKTILQVEPGRLIL